MPDPKKGKRFSARHIALRDYRRKQVDTWGGRAIPESEHLMVLEDHLSVSLRRRSKAYPLFKLQLALLLDVVEAEKAVATAKDKVAELEREPEDASRKGRLDGVQGELQKFTTIRRALRDIGDGIAWRLLDYDRAALSTLASHPRKPHINLEGLWAELHVLGDVYNDSGESLAILNDLTHFLKKADVTVRVDDTTFEFLEVKASPTKSGTLKRQRADLIETLRFLSEGQGLQADDVVSIQELPIVPTSHLKAVAPFIREAEETGSAAGIIGEHLAVELIDWPKAYEIDLNDASKLERASEIVDRWERRGDLVLKNIGTERYHEVRNYAPYSIYALPPLQRVKLMTGALLTRSSLNVSAVLRYIQSRGWTLVHGPETHVDMAEQREGGAALSPSLPIATFKKDGVSVDVPAPWLGRVAFEYLAPKTIADALDAVLAAPSIPPGAAFIAFAGELQQWD